MGRKTKQFKNVRFVANAAIRQEGLCIYCSVDLTKADGTIEHIIPRAWGGTDSRENLAIACDECNSGKAGIESVAIVALHKLYGGTPKGWESKNRLQYAPKLILLLSDPFVWGKGEHRRELAFSAIPHMMEALEAILSKKCGAEK